MSSYPVVVLRVFQLLTVVAPTTFLAAATIVNSFSETKEPKESNLRKFQLGSACIAALLSSAEAVIDIKRSDPYQISDPDAVYALFLSLVWVILSLSLVGTPISTSYPHIGTWTILLVCQSTVFALSLPGTSLKDRSLFARSILQGAQLAVEIGLLGDSLLIRFVRGKEVVGNGDETRPLLGNESSPHPSGSHGETQTPNEEETDRQRIRTRPFWQYLGSFKLFVPYMYPRSSQMRMYFGGMFVANVSTRIVTIALPLSLGSVINGLGETIPWKSMAVYVFLWFLMSHAALPLIETWLSWRVRADLIVALQRHCYSHIMKLSADFHDSKRSSVIWQTTSQGQDVIDLLHDGLFQTLPTIADLVFATVVLTCLFGLYMTFIITSMLVLFFGLTFKTLVRKRSMRRSWVDAYHEQYYQMSESSLNWSAVCHSGRIPYEIQRYREKGDTTQDRMLILWFYEFWTQGLRYLIPGISFVAACSVAALQISHHQHKIGDFVVLITYWAQVTGPLTTLASATSGVTEKLVNAEKLVLILEKKPRIQDLPDARPFVFLEGAVEFENASFSYDGKRQIVKGITFRAAPGKTVALVGQTGGGKSTILKLLFRFYDVDQGRILIDGQDIRHINLESFRKHIGMVPQSPVVFNMSVLDNVRYPDIDCTDEEAMDACKAAALHDKIMSFTHGYHEKVGERGTKLSSGELQRLAIARAILKKADILLLDEATSSVDSITEKKIQNSIRQLCAGKTAFVIAHRLSTVVHADHILVIEDGEIIESGTHETLIKQNGAYNELWSSQLRLQAGESKSKSQSCFPPKTDALVLVNDMSSGEQETQTLVERTMRGSENEDTECRAPESTSDPSSIHEHQHRSHQASHDAVDSRDRTNAKRLACVLGARLPRSKSPGKGGSSESSLNPDARTFRPRRFQDYNNTTSFTTSDPRTATEGHYGTSFGAYSAKTRIETNLSNQENDVKWSTAKSLRDSPDVASKPRSPLLFPLKRKWVGQGREALGSDEDHSIRST
ncbi:Heavy metal tolerance protein [Fonsecaea pedrosoi]|nr:Heavy metal tolerance protein [Fonsecaea pedrosoi]